MTLEPAASRVGPMLLLKRSHAKDHAPGEWETGSGGVHEEAKWVPLAAVTDPAYPEWLRRAAAIVRGRV